jgi:hypothetical protein
MIVLATQGPHVGHLISADRARSDKRRLNENGRWKTKLASPCEVENPPNRRPIECS